MRDLTVGSAPRSILAYAFPLLVSSVLQQLYNTVDAVIVGRVLGEKALAAVGVNFPFLFLLITLAMSFTMGADTMITRYSLVGKRERLQRTVGTLFTTLIVGGVVFSLLGPVIAEPLLLLIGTPHGILPEAKEYLTVIFLSCVGLFGYNGVSALLRGIGHKKTPQILLLFSSLLNILLDLLFILGFGMGVASAAWATLISQMASFFVAVLLLNRYHPAARLSWEVLGFHGKLLKSIFTSGFQVGFQQVAAALGLITIQGVVNSFGAHTMAACTVATRVNTYGLMPIIILSSTFAAYVGRNLEAGKAHRIRRGYFSVLSLMALSSLLFGALAWLGGETVVGLFNSHPQVQAQGLGNLRIQASFYLAASVLFSLFGLFQGSGKTRIPIIVEVVSLWLIQVPAAVLLSRTMGIAGVWWSRPVSWLAAVAAVLLYYRFGHWRADPGPLKGSGGASGLSLEN